MSNTNDVNAQLPLALQLESFARFESFVPDGNAAALAHLRTLPGSAVASQASGGSVWLCGDESAGKSHLLQAACRSAAAARMRTMYLPLAREGLSPDVLDDLGGLDLLAVDDVDAVAGDAGWERRLFTLFNDFMHGTSSLVIASAQPPLGTGFALADLASRAAACAVYRLEPLDEAGQLRALAAHARVRGLELDDAAARYLLGRVRRDMRDICRWLERLDRAALIAQRRLTIPLIRETLADTTGRR